MGRRLRGRLGLATTPESDQERAQQAVELAARLLTRAAELQQDEGVSARARRRRRGTLVDDRGAAAFTVALTDQVLRTDDPQVAGQRFAKLVDGADIGAFSVADRTLLRAGAALSPRLGRLVMPLVHRRLRQEAGDVILPAEDPALAAHLRARRTAGFRVNVNLLGEAILGNDEAVARRDAVIALVERPDVDHVAVKLSSICAGIEPLAFEQSVSLMAGQLRPVLAAAARQRPVTLVTLDMEEYRDLELTHATFRRLLDEDELLGLEAGIVLQAYLPDTHRAAASLVDWARDRRARGGAGIAVRVVKGANLAMEQAEAELRGWTAAPYPSKPFVDASYLALLDTLLDPRLDGVVRVGVGSHNLFDVAWALLRRNELAERGVAERLHFEMIEGMAPAQAEALREMVGSVLLYAPIVPRDELPAAIAYLVRRLDENTAPQNFLAQLHRLTAGSPAFHAQADAFLASVRDRAAVDTTPRRQQDRTQPEPATTVAQPFANEPDTDWVMAANRQWIAHRLAHPPETRPPRAVTVADVEDVLSRASTARRGWAGRPPRERAELLEQVAQVVSARRGDLVSVMAHEAAKTVREGDTEVSEAIDHARWAARCGAVLTDGPPGSGATGEALGTVVVVPPWNFPLAIPLGGVAAALAAGNAVVLKPAPQTRRTAQVLVDCCHAAGIPDDVLQLVPADDDEAGLHLVTHPSVAAVVMTGSLATAQLFLRKAPELHLHAETSGKNSMIITPGADLDEAIRDLVRSAFGHAGQKCSATSVAILVGSLGRDRRFLTRLADAVRTLRVGAATDLATDMGPLIGPPEGALLRALTQLDPGERWLVAPRPLDHPDPARARLWSPGVRLGVRPGSWFARTECFGPVLGVVTVGHLVQAINVQNDTAFGLTAGLCSLDDDEIEHWIDRVEAGNVYVNRTTTGAIVRRQPFGGWKGSSVGPTTKAGGPWYVASLRRWHDDPQRSADDADAAFRSWMARHLAGEDPSGLVVERNVHRVRPLPGGVVVRLGAETDERALALARAAASAAAARLVVSSPGDETDQELAARLPSLGVDRLRLLGPAAPELRAAAHAAGITVDDQPPTPHADGEMWRWVREQSVTRTVHRHGHLPDIQVHGVP